MLYDTLLQTAKGEQLACIAVACGTSLKPAVASRMMSADAIVTIVEADHLPSCLSTQAYTDG